MRPAKHIKIEYEIKFVELSNSWETLIIWLNLHDGNQQQEVSLKPAVRTYTYYFISFYFFQFNQNILVKDFYG
jgi:hypothetical protein